jgi:hypothetical protein
MKAAIIWSLGMVLMIGTVGCVDHRPIYVEPAPIPGATAKLKGAWGTYILEVDWARVKSADFQLPTFGWNAVRVSAGVHQLTVVYGSSGSSVKHWFSFRCDADHTYELSPASLISRVNVLTVTDKNTNQSMEIVGKQIGPNGPPHGTP